MLKIIEMYHGTDFHFHRDFLEWKHTNLEKITLLPLLKVLTTRLYL